MKKLNKTAVAAISLLPRILFWVFGLFINLIIWSANTIIILFVIVLVLHLPFNQSIGKVPPLTPYAICKQLESAVSGNTDARPSSNTKWGAEYETAKKNWESLPVWDGWAYTPYTTGETYNITSVFGAGEAFRGGEPHNGSDLDVVGANPNPGLYAVTKGLVVAVVNNTGPRGLYVAVAFKPAEGPPQVWMFQHLQSIDPGIKLGEIVELGQLIGLEGRTGQSTSEHLHMERSIAGDDRGVPIWVNTLQVPPLADPLKYFYGHSGALAGLKGGQLYKYGTYEKKDAPRSLINGVEGVDANSSGNTSANPPSFSTSEKSSTGSVCDGLAGDSEGGSKIPLAKDSRARAIQLAQVLKAEGLHMDTIRLVLLQVRFEGGAFHPRMCEGQFLAGGTDPDGGCNLNSKYFAAANNIYSHPTGGAGLLQWTYWSRKAKLFSLAEERGVKWYTLEAQGAMFAWELKNDYKYANELRGFDYSANYAMCTSYVRPGGASGSMATECGRRANATEEKKLINDIVNEAFNAGGRRGQLTPEQEAAVIATGRKYIGVPYVWGGTAADGMDCSGFTKRVYSEALGVDIKRVTSEQEFSGDMVPLDQLAVGDLLFWGARGKTYHVALYIGSGRYIHAPEPGKTITEIPYSSYPAEFAIRPHVAQR